MRTLRIAAPWQSSLDLSGEKKKPGWWMLPESTRQLVLGLLARLIARSIVDEDGVDDA